MFDRRWNPRWSKAVIVFGYYNTEMMIWLLLHQLHVNVLQGKLCVTYKYSNPHAPSCVPIYTYISETLWGVWGQGYMYTTHTTIMCIIFFFFFRKSASCTHVSALLHALVAATFTEFTIRPSSSASTSEEELPVTSYPCQWKAPKKRKQSTIRFADSIFEKHVYGKVKKRRLEPLEDFDPRPDKFKGTAKNSLPALLNDLHGEELCISLLLDSNLCPNDGATLSSSSAPASTNLPSWRNRFQPSRKAYVYRMKKFVKSSWIPGSRENQPCGFKLDAIVSHHPYSDRFSAARNRPLLVV